MNIKRYAWLGSRLPPHALKRKGVMQRVRRSKSRSLLTSGEVTDECVLGETVFKRVITGWGGQIEIPRLSKMYTVSILASVHIWLFAVNFCGTKHQLISKLFQDIWRRRKKKKKNNSGQFRNELCVLRSHMQNVHVERRVTDTQKGTQQPWSLIQVSIWLQPSSRAGLRRSRSKLQTNRLKSYTQ